MNAWRFVIALVACGLLVGVGTTGSGDGATGVDRSSAVAVALRPALRFDTEEHWRPLDIEAFLQERQSSSIVDHRVCLRPNSQRCGAGALTGSRGLGRGRPWLDISGKRRGGLDFRSPETGCRSTVVFDCPAGPRSAIYVHEGAAPATPGGVTYRYLDYWWFYRFNAANALRLLSDAFDHEGDWEGTSVVLDRGGSRIEWVEVAAHKHVWAYWPSAVQWDGGHPTVYVARGTHASYVRPCGGWCDQGEKSEVGVIALPERPFDGKRPWAANSDSLCTRWDCLKRLDVGLGPLTARWPGHWGSTRRENFKKTLALVAWGKGSIPGFGGGANMPRELKDVSPCSPAFQSRFRGAATPAASSGPDPCSSAGAGSDIATCDRWFGPFVVAAVCNESLLRAGLRTGALDATPSFRLEVVRASGSSRGELTFAAGSGLVQAVGDAFGKGDTVRVVGEIPVGTVLLVRARGGLPLDLRQETQTISQPTTPQKIPTVVVGGSGAVPDLQWTPVSGGGPTDTALAPPAALSNITAAARGSELVIEVSSAGGATFDVVVVQSSRVTGGEILSRSVEHPVAGRVTVPLAPGARFVTVAPIGQGLVGRPLTTRIR